MNRKWKIAFLISLTINFFLIIGGGYFLFVNTLTSGNSYDNLITITQDLNKISKAIKTGANTIDEFDAELHNSETGHWTDRENNLISFQIVHVLFDKNGNFEKIETYMIENE